MDHQNQMMKPVHQFLEQSNKRPVRKAGLKRVRVRLSQGSQMVDAICTNISETGMRVRMQQSQLVQIGDMLDIELPQLGMVRAVVRWAVEINIGIEFIEILSGTNDIEWPAANTGVFEVPSHLRGHAARDQSLEARKVMNPSGLKPLIV